MKTLEAVTLPPDLRDAYVRRLEEALRCIDGRWKLPIIAYLCASECLRFSDLERVIPRASQKMLTQHLRELERDGIVARTVHPQVPPKVEYRLTELGHGLRPALLSLIAWADAKSPHEALPRLSRRTAAAIMRRKPTLGSQGKT